MKPSQVWHLTAIFIAVTFATSLSLAADPGDKADWDRELSQMLRERPTEYSEMRRMFTLVAEFILAELGYGLGPFSGIADPKVQDAVRRYEKNRGIPVTGDPMSFDTAAQLMKDRASYEHRVLTLPPLSLLFASWSFGRFSAQGTWTISGETMGFPVQTTRISCSKETKACVEATAMVSGTAPERNLELHTNEYEIERWDNDEIVTKPVDFNCVRYVLRVNRIQGSVTALRSTISKDDRCSIAERKDKLLVLKDGDAITRQLAEQREMNLKHLRQMTPALAETPRPKEPAK